MATKLIMAKNPGEALEFIADDAAFLAGGTEVNRLGSSVHAETLISLKKCSGMDSVLKDGGKVCIGAMCTFQKLLESDAVPPYLKEALCFMASRTKRNMATIGGNIAALRSDSYLLPVLLASEAEVTVLGKDGAEKCLALADYIDAVKSGETLLITAVIVPEDAKVVSKRYSNTAQSHAVLTMSAACAGERFTLAAALKNSGLYLFEGYEEAVSAFDEIPYTDDMFGSPEYKRYLIGVTAEDMYKALTEK